MKFKKRQFKAEKAAAQEIAESLREYLFEYNKRKTKNKKLGEPIIVCVGSDLAIYDAVGPLCGTLLKRKLPDVSLYGSLDSLQTAKNIRQTAKYLKKEYPNRPIIAIDAAVTDESVGEISIRNQPLNPGTGIKRNLGKIGQITVMALTMHKDDLPFNFHITRLGMVYAMAETISDGVVMFLNDFRKNR